MNSFLSKMLSGRFLVVIGLTATLCSLAWVVVNKFHDNKELVALIVGQFIFICKDIIIKYFDRIDRVVEGQQTLIKTESTMESNPNKEDVK